MIHLGAVKAHAALFGAVLIASQAQPPSEVASVLFDAFYAGVDPLLKDLRDTVEQDRFLAGSEEAKEELDLQASWINLVESIERLHWPGS